MDVVAEVSAAVHRHPAVTDVNVVGSRVRGGGNPLSDWDIRIEATDLDQLIADLPSLVQPLEPLAEQWDRLCERAVYMIMLPGAIKVDLFPGDKPHTMEPPWELRAENLVGIDEHFWDWILWLGSKALGDQQELVAAELEKMQVHLLGPLGSDSAPRSVGEAVEQYLRLRGSAEQRFNVAVDRHLEESVVRRLREHAMLD